MSRNKMHPHALSKKVSHAFPGLIGGTADGDKNSVRACQQFRPMFRGSTSNGVLNHSIATTPHASRQDDPLEKASQRGYEKGYAAGQTDACELVQNELTPIMDDIQDALIRCGEFREKIAEIYSINSLKLALSIVERITGEAPLVSMEDLSAVRSVINNALLESLGLNLQFNPDDYQCIESLSACKNNIDWSTYQQMGISINPNEAITSGAVQSVANQLEWQTLKDQVETALDRIMVATDETPSPE